MSFADPGEDEGPLGPETREPSVFELRAKQGLRGRLQPPFFERLPPTPQAAREALSVVFGTSAPSR